MLINKQTFLVLGVSKSGSSVADYIIDKGGKCYLFEELNKPHILDNINRLIDKGAVRVYQEDIELVLSKTDILVISPGVAINHPVAVLAKKLGVRIIGELEFGYLAFTPNICAVTGTNGKTTTVSLLEHIFNCANISCRTVGNIGTPLTSKVNEIKNDEILFTEVSSFQLESVSSFCPHISAILNISPDHMERHYTLDNYIFLKKRIFKNQKSSEYTILNYDDEIVKTFADESKANIIYVSTIFKVKGAYRENGKLYYLGEYIIDENELSLSGEHNIYNSLFAIAISKLYGVENEVIKSALKTFKGVKHRIEHICTKNGVEYYNDSKSTNTASTLSALKSIKTPIVLILGGSEKGEDYSNFFEQIKLHPIKQIILTGASRF